MMGTRDGAITTLVLDDELHEVEEKIPDIYLSSYQRIVNMVKAISLDSSGIINFTNGRGETQE